MRRVMIFYASYGGGHLSAARSIKEYIETNYKDINVELIDCIYYANKIFDKITTMAYSEMAKKAPKTYGKIYSNAQSGPIAQISTTSNKLLSVRLKKLFKDGEPDLIIITHPFASTMCAYLKKQGKINSKIATILTDYAPHGQWLVFNEYVDYYFVSHEEMKKQLNKAGIPKDKIYPTGIPLSNKFLLKYDKAQILKNFGLSPNKKTVLFFGGGEYGLGKNQTIKIFKSFIKCHENLQLVAISGKNQKMKESFENLVSELGKQDSVKILEYTDKVPQLMSISDLVVTKPGGLTTSESLASHLPMIIINPIPGQEEENAEFLESKGIAIWIKNGSDSKTIIELLLSNKEKLESMKQNTNILAKPFSTEEICNILLG